jgi:vancomycin resistance protein YoaR
MVRSGLALGVVAGALLWGKTELNARLVPAGCVAQGLVVDGEAVQGCREAAGIARARVAARLERRIAVVDGDRVLFEATLAELGAAADEERLARAIGDVGHRGPIWQALDEAEEARAGRTAVSLTWRLPIEGLVARLATFKALHDEKPISARWDFSTNEAVPHRNGAVVDLHATAEALVAAGQRGAVRVPVVVVEKPPSATREVVAAVDRSAVISRYETRYAFVGNQAGRAQNIAVAAAGIDGQVMMPGEVLSFNELVGPRSEDNGFAEAGEIYKGEMRMGIGGGTCQVASTFYAAAYFGALEVVERSPHSRPSGYIGIGLDATVAYPHVDLQLRNPFPFPVMIHAVADQGRLTVEILGREQPAAVDLRTATVAVTPYKRQVRETSWLEEGKVVRKQGGRRGVTIEKVRTMRYGDGSVRVETTRDVYPPTQEIFYVPRGADRAALLPPLPEGAAEG